MATDDDDDDVFQERLWVNYSVKLGCQIVYNSIRAQLFICCSEVSDFVVWMKEGGTYRIPAGCKMHYVIDI